LDNLTHTLTGLMLARALVPKSVPRAGLLMMIAANGPDIDLLWSWPGGMAHYLEYHRGISHSLACSPLLALLPVVIVWALERRRIPWLWVWLFAWIAGLTHLALDWTNVYGIRMLLPIASTWLRLDSVNIVDPLVWAILLLGVAAPALGKLVSAEIGAKSGKGTGWAIFVLLLLGAYEGGRLMAHDRAVRMLDSRIYEGVSPARVAAFAQALNPLEWKGVVETSASYIVFYMNLRDEFDPGGGRVFYKAQPARAMEAAKKTRDFMALIRFSSFPLWRVTPVSEPEGGSRVDLFDLRFGTPAAPGLAATAIVDAAGVVRSTNLGFGSIQPR
jgi:inner membrane protein